MIDVQALSKKYKIYARPFDRVKEWVIPTSTSFHRDFWALRDVTFHIRSGSAVGIIGINGAGKSTLLKILTGTTKPSSGNFRVEGKVAALLELGMGFHPEFTGRQNVMLNGRLLGLTSDELEAKIPDIIRFSELGDFIDQPLRTYSSGMYVRLGFAVATSLDPQVLIIDEALAVGDAYFQQKCIRRLRQFHEQGVTILFVSHDPGTVKTLCEEAILLDEGHLLVRGKPDDVLDYYNALIASKSPKQTGFTIERVAAPTQSLAVQHSGNFLAVITDVAILNDKGQTITTLIAGQRVRVRLNVFFLDRVENPTIGLLIKDRLGNEIFGTNSYKMNQRLGTYNRGDTLSLSFTFAANIGSGEYTLTAAVHTLDVHLFECYDWADKILLFTVVPSTEFEFVGAAKLYPELSFDLTPGDPTRAREMIHQIFHDATGQLTMGLDSQKFLCKGWYEPEGFDPEHVRWTDEEFAFFVRVTGNQLVLEASCGKPDIATSPMEGTIYAEGQQVGMFRLADAEWHTLTFTLPETLLNHVVLFTVRLNAGWSPAALLESHDRRTLGILVRRIAIVSASVAEQ